MTEFNNCFIFRSPNLFFNEYFREAKRSSIFTQEKEKSVVSFTHEQNIICSQTVGRHCAGANHYLKAVIRRSHGGHSANQKGKKFALHYNYEHCINAPRAFVQDCRFIL